MKSLFSYYNAKKFKALLQIAVIAVILMQITPARASEFRRLEDNIANLKSKIRSSATKDPKDIQKLYKLENELEKKKYLKNNNKAR